MPNSWFRFKQFVIHQDRSAMKVCTDSCILGAWSVLELQQAKSILDIGTGTGLLALMLAQKSNAAIDAIEFDPDSAGQARENTMITAWYNRIRVVEGDVRNFSPVDGYDFIITNPPFFENDLRSPESKKNKAKHDESLTLDELLTSITNHLKPDGRFSILLPYERTGYFEELAGTRRFFLSKKLTVRQTQDHAPFRSICLFSYQKTTIPKSEILTIKEHDGKYSQEFVSLLEDFYLNLPGVYIP